MQNLRKIKPAIRARLEQGLTLKCRDIIRLTAIRTREDVIKRLAVGERKGNEDAWVPNLSDEK